MPGDHLPVAVLLREVRRTLVQENGRAGEERAIHDIAVSRHPSDVSGAPEDVLVAEIEDVPRGGVNAHGVAADGMHDPLRLARRPGRVEDEQRVL